MGSLNVADGECSPTLCLGNLTLLLETNQIGVDRALVLDGEYNRSWDADSGRYLWVNQRNPDLQWLYQEFTNDDGAWIQNWVLREDDADRVACAPGSTEMPLFCTTYVYAGGALNAHLSSRYLGVPGETRWLLQVSHKGGNAGNLWVV